MRAVQHAVRRIHGLSRTVAVRRWGCRAGSDLITDGRRCIESRSGAPFKHRPPPRSLLSTSTMSSVDPLVASLASLSITPAASVSHPDANSPASWRDALLATAAVPESFELIKTLVYKPKTAKTATPVPVVVIARDETETSSSALGRKLNLKELRLASEDLLAEFFGLDKNSRMFPDLFVASMTMSYGPPIIVSPLALNKDTFSKVVTVIDASIASSSATFAIHACSSRSTLFLSGNDIVRYLKSLETEDVKIGEVDFAALKTDESASKPVVNEKEEAKIEGSVQIAIGVKKEADFSAWYQNVSATLDENEICILNTSYDRFC